MNNIWILKGDIVNIEMSTYDLSKGRIVFRRKINIESSEIDNYP